MPVKLLQYIIPAIASVVFNCQINIAQDNQGMKMRFMFYNVENLFDTYDDPLTEDNEFLPDGLRGWNMTRYSTKLLSLYKVIMAAGEGDVPVIAGLCEVENKKVIEDLLMLTPLKMNNNYNIVHEDSDDP
ncbi:MAG: endonuclease/exonuclease/phosphatase family protein, partial [Bacteroidales bacterium]